MAIFEAVKYIEKRNYRTRSVSQLLYFIQELSSSALPDMSPEHYLDQLQAISLLADAAVWKLDHD